MICCIFFLGQLYKWHNKKQQPQKLKKIAAYIFSGVE